MNESRSGRKALMDTLPDFIDDPVHVLSVGINPSLHAVRAGYPFAFPRNRFWPALNASRLVAEPLTPGREAMRILSRRYGIGFTDVVKRPTPGLRDLRAADFAASVPRLLALLERCRPKLLWFHGKVAAREFKRRTGAPGAASVTWGMQDEVMAGLPCYVSPNPSPANAAYSLDDIVASYDALAALGVLAENGAAR